MANKLKDLIIMPEFANHEVDLSLVKGRAIDVITYDEKTLVTKKKVAILALPVIAILSLFGIINYYRVMYYLRNYRKLNQYISARLAKVSMTQYKNVLWIKAAGIDHSVINQDGSDARKRYLYLYDPIDRYPDVEKKFNFFNGVYTFDPNDSRKYNINYLKMFSQIQTDAVADKDQNIINDMIYVGSFTLRRLLSLLILKIFTRSCRTRLILVNTLLPKISIFGIEINNKPITRESLFALYTKSKVIIELRADDQAGYSQRENDSIILQRSLVVLQEFRLREVCNYFNLSNNLKKIRIVANDHDGMQAATLCQNRQLSVEEFLDTIFCGR